IVSTGYFRHGILLAAFGARCTRELVLGEDPSIDLSACDPLRFAR
ncbi:TPA: glycine oxidase ThiO, partial [Corynebacterium striatum]|nr:glycine oxidase ThiO [Corynebacterium striatum]